MGYLNYPTYKRYVWASSQISREGFRKLQETIWITVINEIFKFTLHDLDSFGQENYLYEVSSRYQNYPTQI